MPTPDIIDVTCVIGDVGSRDSVLRNRSSHIRVAAMVSLPKFKLPPLPEGTTNPKNAQTGTREVFLKNEWIESNIYQKSQLKANNIIEGPSIIEQHDSTTLVDTGWIAEVMNDRHLLLKRLNSG